MRSKITSVRTKRTACFLALVYVWLSAFLQLAHTDDLSAFAPVHSTAAVAQTIRHADYSGPSQPCLAHEWSGATHTASQPSVTVQVAFQSYSASPAPAVIGRERARLDENFSRGPPAFIIS